MKIPRRRECLDKIKPYVPGKPIDEVKREMGIADVIKMASNENALGASMWVNEAIREALPAINYYPDGNCFELKEELVSRLGVKSEELIIGNGSDEILKLLAETYLEPGDEIIMPTPSFSEYEFVTRIMGGEIVTAPLEGPNFDYDLKDFARMINEQTRLIFICSPNNPTGSIVSHEELDKFLKKLPEGIIVVIDEAYCEYVANDNYHRSLEFVKREDPVIVLRTFSKIYGIAGLRIGYGIAPAPIIADLNRVREPFNVNYLAQVAALAALKDEKHREDSFNLVAAGRKQITEGLDEMGLKPARSEANFFFVDVGEDSVAVFKHMLKKGVIVRTGDIFGFPTYIRVTYGTKEENARFLKALEETLNELK